MKFPPAKKHLPAPVPRKSDISVHVPRGRTHFAAKMDEQKPWVACMKTNNMIPIKEPRKTGHKLIPFEVKDQRTHMYRKHYQPRHQSLGGPTYDKKNWCMRMYAERHKPTLQ